MSEEDCAEQIPPVSDFDREEAKWKEHCELLVLRAEETNTDLNAAVDAVTGPHPGIDRLGEEIKERRKREKDLLYAKARKQIAAMKVDALKADIRTLKAENKALKANVDEWRIWVEKSPN